MKKYLLLLACFFCSLNLHAEGPMPYYENPCFAIEDPLEKINRKIFTFNGVLDYMTLRPWAKAYRTFVPNTTQKKVSNFLDNLKTPFTLINNVLQGNLNAAFQNTWKFFINSTIGVGGIYKITDKIGLRTRQQTFGSTLARYGVKPGPYIVLPFLSNTNARDIFDILFLERHLNPTSYYIKPPLSKALVPTKLISNRAMILPFTDYVTKTSPDPYTTIKIATHHKREKEVVYPSKDICNYSKIKYNASYE